MKYDLKGVQGHRRFLLKNPVFIRYIFCLKYNLIKTLYECKHHKDANFPLNEV